jgi:hypothetical protein
MGFKKPWSFLRPTMEVKKLETFPKTFFKHPSRIGRKLTKVAALVSKSG